ncbi:MAG: cytochrome P450 [Ktedonobacterales bacterium]
MTTSEPLAPAEAPTDPFDIFSPAFSQNPYPFYAWLRDHDPVHWGVASDVGEPGMWHIARYADVLHILREPRFIHRTRPSLGELPPPVALFLELAGQSLLFNNPPAHTRLRRLVGKAFTPRAIEDLRVQVVTTSDALLAELWERERFDVVRDYAQPLTLTIISAMLGIPKEAQPQILTWANALVRAVDCKRSPEVFVQAGAVAEEIYAYFVELIERTRRQPDESILSALIQAHDAGDSLSESEIVVTATTLLMAGHETTVNLIGNGVAALLRTPDQLALLRAQADNPQLVADAVEECLRYDAPSQMTSRIASTDVEVGGVRVQEGQSVNLLLGSGNRDPEAFSDPDRFDITRSENRHLSFGMGIHYCLGAPLARVEGQVALPALAQRFPTLQMAPEGVTQRDTIGFRGLARLIVRQRA